MGEEPASSYYKPCDCGRSDLERKARQQFGKPQWTPLDLNQLMEKELEDPEAVEVQIVQDLPSAPTSKLKEQTRLFRTNQEFKNAWLGFSETFHSVRQETVGAIRQNVGSVQEQLLSPTAISHQYPNRPRRFRKSWSITTWFQRFSSQVSTCLSFRPTDFLTWRNTSIVPEKALKMSDSRRLMTSSRSTLTFEYENPAFEKDLEPGEEIDVGKWTKEQQDDENSTKSFPTSANRYSLENNFTIGSTTSLIVAMLSQASFAYFILWFLLYCSTLHVILPEMKYLHKYVTLCSLVLMTSLNVFRFYICRNATTNQNSYLFTGTKTLTGLVIGALASLLVTDAYAEPPRAFHIIISSILMGLLTAEGIAIVCHHRVLRTFMKSRIESRRPASPRINFQRNKTEKRH